MEGEGLADIIPFDQWRRKTETIGGVQMKLGVMSLDQLVVLEEACRTRVVDAQTDRWLVQYYIERRPNGEPDGAA